MTGKTIRLVVPDWQAGNNSIYKLGAQILETIAPKNKNQETIEVKILDSKQPLKVENNIAGQTAIKENVEATKSAILAKAPDKIITLGGTCLVSQTPIDYLNGKYEKLGIVWIDAHPDISTPEIFNHEHAMVVGNLLHRGDPRLAKLVDHPLKPEQIYYPALAQPVDEEKQLLKEAGLHYAIIQRNQLDLVKAQEWIKKNGFTHLYIHLDVDVMNPDPKNFYPTYFNNPEIKEIPYNAAVGKVSRLSVWKFISELSKENNLVGFGIAEFMPWGAQAMQKLMKETKIF